MKKLIILLFLIASYLQAQTGTFPFSDNFEDGDITGWVKRDAYTFGDLVINSSSPINGTYDMRAYAASSFSAEFALLSYSFPTTAGKIYTLTFKAYGNGTSYSSYARITTGYNGTNIDAHPDFAAAYPSDVNIPSSVFPGTTYTASFTASTTDSCSIGFEFQGGFGNRQLFVDDITFTEASADTLGIKTPAASSFNISPFVITWTGNANYDSAYIYVNDALVDSVDADSVYLLTTALTGTVELKVAQRDDTSIADSINVTVVVQGLMALDSGYAVGNTLNYDVRLGNLIGSDDSLRFFIGEDTLSMTTVQTIVAPSGYKDTTYSFAKPADFWSTGSVWYKVATVEDSVDNYTDPSLNFIGQLGGVQICWYPQQNYPIEVLGVKDVSCGWVDGIEKQYTSTRLNIPQTGLPTVSFFSNACPAPYAGCTWAQATFQAQDTSGGGTAVTSVKYSQTVAYLNTGASSITVDNRRYYIFAESVYMDDIANGVDSTEVLDLSTYFDNSSMLDPSLWYFPYQTGITDTIVHDGTIDTELPARDTTLIVIYEPSGFQRIWSFNALVAPAVYGQILSDTFLASESIADSRNYFRGIDPKFVREP